MASAPTPPSPTPPPSLLRRAARVGILSFILGLLTSLAAAVICALSADPPDTPPTVLRSFIAHDQPWTTFESAHFGARRSLWSLLTFDSMFSPQDIARRYPNGTPTDHAVALDTFREMYEPLVEDRVGGRALRQPALWGQFAPGSSAPEPGLRGSDYCFGWPFTCLWYQVLGQDQGLMVIGADLRGGLLVSGKPAAVGTARCRIIPLLPAWPELIGNMLIYAATWATLLVFIPMLLRANRRRRGLCPACAYDLRATPAGSPCPECGNR